MTGSNGAVSDTTKLRRRTLHHWDDDDDEIPDMSSTFHPEYTEEMRQSYLSNKDNKDKVTLTRFVNASVITAVVCGLQRRLHIGGKR